MFVNNIPFLFTLSHGIKLVTAENIKSRTAKQLAKSINRNPGNVAYMRHFSNYLRSRVSSVVIFWSEVTHNDDYESSALALQHRFFNHPRRLKCKGAVRRQKSCLFSILFLYNMSIFSKTNIDQSLLATAEGLVVLVQGGGLQNTSIPLM